MSNEYPHQPEQPPVDPGAAAPGHGEPYGARAPGYGHPHPAHASGYGSGAVKPNNNLVWAILATILCCMPFGVVAIVYAAKVDGLWAQGQHADAESAASTAKTWAIASAVCGVIWVVLWTALAFGTAAASSTDPDYSSY